MQAGLGEPVTCRHGGRDGCPGASTHTGLPSQHLLRRPVELPGGSMPGHLLSAGRRPLLHIRRAAIHGAWGLQLRAGQGAAGVLAGQSGAWPSPCPGCVGLGWAERRGGGQGWTEREDPCLQPCDSSAFAVLAELRRCGLTDSETCLRSLTLSLGGGQTVSAHPGGWGWGASLTAPRPRFAACPLWVLGALVPRGAARGDVPPRAQEGRLLCDGSGQVCSRLRRCTVLGRRRRQDEHGGPGRCRAPALPVGARTRLAEVSQAPSEPLGPPGGTARVLPPSL